uniref:Fe2OG dioxygenase domain-containing protein n=1 Tax=Arcella intermedia TaxID=1963864 RepID=A0A6B2LF18_9EUKA
MSLRDNAQISYHPDLLTPAEAKSLYEHVKQDIPLTHGHYVMFGKSIPTPRLLSCVAESDISDSYTVTPWYPFTPQLNDLKAKLEKFCKCHFKYAQINYYRDGKDYIGFHSDSEVKEGEFIASISLGQTRRFVLRHKKWKENCSDKEEFSLKSGSLLLMKGDTQKYWKHSVPKQLKITEGRINLTFRNS